MWTEAQEIHGTKTLTCKLDVNSEMEISEEFIQQELVKQLATQLSDQNLVAFYHHNNPYQRSPYQNSPYQNNPYQSSLSVGMGLATDFYEAQITVTSPGTSKSIISTHHYEVAGVSYSHDEIEQAIKYTYPERFL